MHPDLVVGMFCCVGGPPDSYIFLRDCFVFIRALLTK
jgi:hypothetical protein